MADLLTEVTLLLPWLPPELAQVYADAWADSGSTSEALATMRQNPLYELHFPGNMREDGTIRHTETQYLALVEGYSEVLTNAGVNPDLFTSSYGDLIAGSTSIDEFSFRIDQVVSRVVNNIDELSGAFARQAGIDPGQTPLEAFIAFALDPNLATSVLERTISLAEITAEATSQGFGINKNLSNRLLNFGVDQLGARQAFTTAASQLPFLEALAARHYDPDDTFSLSEFLDASVFSDPLQTSRIEALLAQEQSLFRQGSAVSSTPEGLTGLSAT